MNTYTGYHSSNPDHPEHWYSVQLNGHLFDPKPSQAVRNHSPDGFAYGYYGSGPAQLALGILLEEFGPAIAQTHYQHFKEDVVARLPNGEGDRWTLTSEQVNKWFTQYGTS